MRNSRSSNKESKASKACLSCGRSFDFRRKWASNWDSVKFCSDECRRNKNNYNYKDAILDLLKTREHPSTICPSDVLVGEDKKNPELMEHVRRSARLLALENLIEICQKGKPVDISSFKGPIRLRLKR
jgi:hypothetical protein